MSGLVACVRACIRIWGSIGFDAFIGGMFAAVRLFFLVVSFWVFDFGAWILSLCFRGFDFLYGTSIVPLLDMEDLKLQRPYVRQGLSIGLVFSEEEGGAKDEALHALGGVFYNLVRATGAVPVEFLILRILIYAKEL